MLQWLQFITTFQYLSQMSYKNVFDLYSKAFLRMKIKQDRLPMATLKPKKNLELKIYRNNLQLEDNSRFTMLHFF